MEPLPKWRPPRRGGSGYVPAPPEQPARPSVPKAGRMGIRRLSDDGQRHLRCSAGGGDAAVDLAVGVVLAAVLDIEIQPLAPSAGSTYRLKLSVLRPSASDALNEVRPIGISMPLGRLAGASLRTSSVMRAWLSGISLPFWLPATRVWSRVEATAACWLSLMPSPFPSPARPAEPSGRSRPAAWSSRLFGTPSRSSSGAPAPGASGVAGATGGWVRLVTALAAKLAASSPVPASCSALLSLVSVSW